MCNEIYRRQRARPHHREVRIEIHPDILNNEQSFYKKIIMLCKIQTIMSRVITRVLLQFTNGMIAKHIADPIVAVMRQLYVK